MDFTQFNNATDIFTALKEERLKTKYSAEYHAQVLQKIFDEMPVTKPNQVKLKIEVIILLVGTLFQTAKSSFLPHKDWVTVYDHVQELLKLAQTPDFIAALK